MKEKKILIRGGELVLPDRIVRDGVVLVKGDIISFVGDFSSFVSRYGLRAVDNPGLMGIGAVFDFRDKVVVPALVEIHIHGAGGYDFETPGNGKGLEQEQEIEHFEACARFLSSRGVGIFLPTVAFDEYVIKRIAGMVENYSGKNPHMRNRIPGIYVEGPFISVEKRGGIRDEYIMGFSEEVFKRIYSLSLGLLKVMTFAPEVEGADRLLEVLMASGIIPSLGHSNSDLVKIESLVKNRRGNIREEYNYNVTHLFNGMSGVSHKSPGLAHWALLNRSVFTELNCDETHVHPLALRLVFELRPWERIIMISDANSASGFDGSGELGANILKANGTKTNFPLLRGKRLYVEGNGVYDFETKTLVGSRLLVKDSIKRVVDNYSIPLTDVIKMVSLNPLRMLGIKGRGELREGMKADISVFDRDFRECVLQIFDGNVTFRK